MIQHNRTCFVNHMGFWLCEPHWFQQAVAAITAGVWQPSAVSDSGRYEVIAGKVVADPQDQERVLYKVTNEGTAVISLVGPMMKGQSKYGGASTVAARRAVRDASANNDVANILLMMDSPGGHVSGTQSLADDVRAARAQKPVHAHIDDLGASAAYWVASQAETISANRTARIGSIGTVAVAYDESEAFRKEGVKVHVISTGDHKGAFVPGSEVKPEHLAELKREVNALNEYFLVAVGSGRKMTLDQVTKLADGRVHLAKEAQGLGLIDHVRSMDETLAALAQQAQLPGKNRRAAAERGIRMARLRAGMFTMAEMAKIFGVPVHRVKYAVSCEGVVPVATTGRVNTYDKCGFDRIKKAIAAMDSRR